MGGSTFSVHFTRYYIVEGDLFGHVRDWQPTFINSSRVDVFVLELGLSFLDPRFFFFLYLRT